MLYAVSSLPEESDKRRRARALLAEDDLAISVQVLQESCHQATRPSRPARPTHDGAVGFLELFLRLPIQAVTVEIFGPALSIRARFGLSYRDGAILAAAHVMGCDAVCSEDMSAEQDCFGLRAIDPFAERGGGS